MKKILHLLCLCIVFVPPALTLCQDRGGDVRMRVSDERGNLQKGETLIYERSYALLIGNTRYQDRAWNDLPDVDDDIAAVREVLEKQHGFKVEVALNLNRDALLRVIDQFISKYGQRYNSRLLIYYSGHGYTALLPDERRMGYLVMPDAPAMPDVEKALRTPPADEEFEQFLPAAITMDEIETYARRITAKHVLFVFDSCFSGTVLYKDLGTSVPTLITTEELKPVRAYLTAGNETQRVPAFSKFRRKFVAGLMGEADTNGDGYILSSELGRWVSIEVETDTGRKQTPVFGKSDIFRRGDMVFVTPNKNILTRAENAWNNFREKAKKLSKYDYTSRFNEELAEVCLNNKCGFINKSGDVVIPLKYNANGTGYFAEGFATVKLNGKYGFIDKTGKIVIPALYDEVTPFHEGLATVKLNDKYGYIDETGKVIIPIKYEYALTSTEGLLGVMLNDKYGFIDKTGRVVIPFEYDQIYAFSNGLAAVNMSEGYSEPHCQYMNTSGNVIIDLFDSYNHCTNFSEGLAAVGRLVGYNKDDELVFKWGFIDNKGKAITGIVYDEYRNFSEGLAAVVKNKKLGFIDKNGREVIPLNYEEGFVSDGLVRVFLNKKYGFLDYKGNEVIPLKYDSVWCYAFQKEGFIGITLNGKKGFVDIYGNEYFNF
jgi:WG containing repeat/Caspase domain